MQIVATASNVVLYSSVRRKERFVKYFKAIAVSLIVALLVLLTESVLMRRDIPVRAGEETQALVKMWPALTAAIGAFGISLKLFTPTE